MLGSWIKARTRSLHGGSGHLRNFPINPSDHRHMPTECQAARQCVGDREVNPNNLYIIASCVIMAVFYLDEYKWSSQQLTLLMIAM